MRRLFVKNLLFTLTLNLLIKAVWIFVIDRTVQNRVGTEAYGIYLALFNMGLIFQIILDFGLNNYNTRIISQNPAKLKEMFPLMLTARLVLSVIYFIMVMLTGYILGYEGWELAMLAGILVIQSFIVTIQYFRSNVAAMQKFRADAVLSVTDRFLMILIAGFLLFYPATAKHFKIEWFILSQIVCYGITAFISFLLLRKIATVKLRLSFETNAVKDIIKKSFPYALLVFLMSFYTRSDVLLLERITGKAEAGIYAYATRLLDVGNILGLMFAGMLLPMFGKMLSEKSNVIPIIRVSINILLPISLITSVAAILFGTPIMELLYNEAGAYEGQVFGILMTCFPSFCITYVYCTLITANGNILLLNKIAFAGAAINLTLNLILIPQYGAIGAATTAAITQLVLAACFAFFASKKTFLPTNIRWVLAHAGFLIVIILLGEATHYLPWGWMIKLLLFGSGGLVLMFAFRFITFRSLRQLGS